MRNTMIITRPKMASFLAERGHKFECIINIYDTNRKAWRFFMDETLEADRKQFEREVLGK